MRPSQAVRLFLNIFIVAMVLGSMARRLPAENTAPPEPVRYGIDVLETEGFTPLQDQQIALITNQTGIDSQGHSTADLLANAPNIRLVALFSPEHGIRGAQEAGQLIGDGIDSQTRLPVYSLYGAIQRPTQPMLNGVDALVFDIQDVGTRFYTYLTTMCMCMEAAAQRDIVFVVLDRPNPLGGEVLEGQMLDPKYRHFTAYYSAPTRHGFTAGELAEWYNITTGLHAKLKVIPMTGWRRKDLWQDTGLPFVPPSPNIRTPREALLYPGLGMFETTNISIGRGTDTPFECFGAPWMDGNAVTARLTALNLAGVVFSSTTFTPVNDLYAGQKCSGVRIAISDPYAVRSIDIFVQAAIILRDLYGKNFQLRWNEVARVTGSSDFEAFYKTGKSAGDVLADFKKSTDRFAKDRQPYLLY